MLILIIREPPILLFTLVEKISYNSDYRLKSTSVVSNESAICTGKVLVAITNESTTANVKGALLLGLLRVIANLPGFMTKGLTFLIGNLSYYIPNKARSVTERNLQLCFPDLSLAEKKQLSHRVSVQNVRLAFEFPTAWFGSRKQVEGLITQVNGRYLLDDLCEQKSPVIIAVPHIGNWEFFWHWLQLNYSAISMYSPAKKAQLDQVMLTARQRFGGQPFATDAKGIMALLRALKKGGVMMILPDQAPRLGAGIYTPFFGQPAYTMTLLHKFIRKTGAKLLFGSCLRNQPGEGFNINLFAPTFATEVAQVEDFNLGLNRQIEEIIEGSKEQYQWSYKRFKRQPQHKNLYANKD